MPKLTKCPNCQTWNENQDYCSNCNHLLSLDIQRELEQKKLEKEEQQRHTKFNNYLAKLKKSNNPIDRIKYTLLNSAWLMFLIFMTILIGMVALAPG